MRPEKIAGCSATRRYCLVCRRQFSMDDLLCDMDDDHRWDSFYCVKCVNTPMADSIAKERAKKAAADWRNWGKDYEKGPPLQAAEEDG